MARTLHRLTDSFARSSQLRTGRHGDGGGLYLNVKEGGSKSWIFLFKRDGTRRATGLGSYPAVGLATARGKAAQLRALIAEGGDPQAQKKESFEPTFAECVDRFLESMEGQWRNEKHRAQWRSTLGAPYCEPLLSKKVSAIGTDDLLRVLTPIWTTKSETASRIRGRIERVLDYAKVRGWRSGENPALWRGHLKSILPARQKLTRGHHAAMPYADVPNFLAQLKQRQAIAARALEFLILTAARSGEVLGATWPEVDFENAVWTVPGNRMKAAREHRVPLSRAALDLLGALKPLSRSDYLFPGQRNGRPLSSMALEMQLRRMKLGHLTVHGFRSSFRDWAGNETNFPRELAEAALAHVVGDATERAYRRSDALEKRRALMDQWSAYCGTGQEKHIESFTGVLSSRTGGA